MMEYAITIIEGLYSQGVFLHLSYILLILFLMFDKYKCNMALDAQMRKNLVMGDQLNAMRLELKQLHVELVALVKENHHLNHEIQLLTLQMNALRDEIKKKKD